VLPLAEAMGAQWSSHASRSLSQLPSGLRWATPVLDPAAPTPVLCDAASLHALLSWQNRLPAHEQVLLGCRKQPTAWPAPSPRARGGA
jgi:hypothetical protein